MYFRYFISLMFISFSCNLASMKTFMTKKYEDNRYLCVTNSSRALAWINMEKSFNGGYQDNQISNFIPIQQNAIDCSISEKHDPCNDYYVKTPWSLKKSLEPEAVLDRRWEAMPLINTLPVNISNKSSPYFHTITKLSGDDFRIPFSVLADDVPHVFLCDGEEPSESNCYWFILNKWEGKTSGVINKCSKHSIPKTIQNFEFPCTNLLNGKTFNLREPREAPLYDIHVFWSHFNIIKNTNYFTLRRTGKFDGVGNSVQVGDEEDVFNVTHLLVYSEGDVFVKIHKLEYIFTNEEHSMNVGPPIKDLHENSVCISMFVSMCISCSLKVELIGKNGENVRETTYDSRGLTWFKVEIEAKDVQNVLPLQMKITTKGNSTHKFWAIDDIKQYTSTGYRMIHSNYQANCQTMEDENNIIYWKFKDNSNYLNDNIHLCQEDAKGKAEITESCIPCKWLGYNNCNSVTICSNECSCSAGFQNVSGYCKSKCNYGYYGFGCQSKCGNCEGPCNNINGNCHKCKKHYASSQCNIPEGIAFKFPPRVVRIYPTRAKVTQDKFNLTSSVSSQLFLVYTVQYKEASYNGVWTSTEPELYNFNLKKHIISISNLTPNTVYNVRSIIKDSKNNVYNHSAVPFTSFTTECPVLSRADFHVNFLYTTVSVKLVWPYSSCKIYNEQGYYNISLLIEELDRESQKGFQRITPREVLRCQLFIKYHSSLAFSAVSFVIGNGNPNPYCNSVTENTALKSGMSYKVTIISDYIFGDKSDIPPLTRSLYSYKGSTLKKSSFELLALLFLLVIPIVVFYVIRHKRITPMSYIRSSVTTDTVEMTSRVPNDEDNSLQTNNLSKPIQLAKYQKYVKVSQKNGELDRQYSMLLKQVFKTVYERIREFYEYVDMEYMDGTKISEAYILTEVPLDGDAIADFWKNVLEDNVKYIILFGDIGPKLNIYWPEVGVKIRCDKTLVEIVSCKVFQHQTHRTFALLDEGRTIQVEQLHCTYDGFCARKFVSFFRKMLKFHLESTSPILVHSTVGCGGIGFVLLCDMCLRIAERDKVVDVMRVFQKLRSYKSGMIKSPEQYKLVHEVILEVLFGPTFNIDLKDDYANY